MSDSPWIAAAPLRQTHRPQSLRRALQRQFSATRLFTLTTVIVIVWGAQAHLERYLSPSRGLGYWLGITGGSLMLLLLIYPARKRAFWLRFIGGIPGWFRIHMVLGVIGPVCVLFHCNFHLGATNSNVALFSMLTVAGSGVIGRYFYTRLHTRLDGGKADLKEMRRAADHLRQESQGIALLPGLLATIEAEEIQLSAPASGAVARSLRVFTVGARAALARRRLKQRIRAAVVQAVQEDPRLSEQADELVASATRYAARRLDAARRVAEFQLFTRLFSFWHVLHVPLFFMLLIAGIVHVISAEIY